MRPLRNWTVFWEFSSDSLRTRELALSQRWFEEGQVYFHFHFWKMHRTHIHWRLPLPSFQPLYSVISHFNPLPRTRRQTGTVEHRFLFVSHKTWCPSKNVFSLSSKSKKWEREREREGKKTLPFFFFTTSPPPPPPPPTTPLFHIRTTSSTNYSSSILFLPVANARANALRMLVKAFRVSWLHHRLCQKESIRNIRKRMSKMLARAAVGSSRGQAPHHPLTNPRFDL